MAIPGTNLTFDGQTDIYRGKVRDVYTINDEILVAIATDRMSAFDVILPQPIPYKGQVINQIAAHFLTMTSDIAPNWLLDVPDPNVLIGRKCNPYEIQMVIRGSLIGHAWRVYEAGARELCGIRLPDGMQEYDHFEEPIITPAAKNYSGQYEDISAIDIVEQGLADESEFERLSIMTRQLFIHGRQQAREQGLVLADTKYEFGLYRGEIYVIDEIHTPDSSRYFYTEGYEAYLKDRTTNKPRNLSKEFVRQWLLDQGFSGLDGQTMPEMGEDFVESISRCYIELYEQLTGKKFVYPDSTIDPSDRIKNNVKSALTRMG